jgi:hypothetical protein
MGNSLSEQDRGHRLNIVYWPRVGGCDMLASVRASSFKAVVLEVLLKLLILGLHWLASTSLSTAKRDHSEP